VNFLNFLGEVEQEVARIGVGPFATKVGNRAHQAGDGLSVAECNGGFVALAG
jgi:hypothetical protein